GGGTSRSRLCCSIGDAHGNHVRKGSFQPKQHLEHLVEKLKLLDLDGGREKEQLCSWHSIPWDVEASGSGRDGPRACGGPSTEEPIQDKGSSMSQEQTQKDLETLRTHREALWELKAHGERRCQDYLARTELQRQAVVLEFRRLRRFLRDQELILLLRLRELDTEAMGRQEQEETKIQGEISLLDVLICAMEKQLEGPGSAFLQVTSRLEMGNSQRTTETFQDLEQKLQVISRQSCVLRDVLGTFQAPFVTLDPSTASPRLVVARDRRGAQWSRTAQAVPGSPLRFNGSCCVLGSPGFAAGAHHWAVGVTGAGAWALGVARGSVARRGWIPFRPDEGVWAVGRRGSRFCAFTDPVTPIPSAGWAGRVRVALDYEGGKVRFYLAEGDPPVFTFPMASFGGESVFPFFWL
ncbi:TRIM7 ligase, partial [Eolophus roseicapillus]|nr:TRIM7 ligase [Eolophus roseicapilla]